MYDFCCQVVVPPQNGKWRKSKNSGWNTRQLKEHWLAKSRLKNVITWMTFSKQSRRSLLILSLHTILANSPSSNQMELLQLVSATLLFCFVAGNSRINPFIFKVTTVSISCRIMTARNVFAEATCRQYLQSLTTVLCCYYYIDRRFTADVSFRDVLAALEIDKSDTEPRWSHFLQWKTHKQIDENGVYFKLMKATQLFQLLFPRFFPLTNGKN